MNTENIKLIASKFNIKGEFLSYTPHGAGHINDTFIVNFANHKKIFRLLFQKINTNIFSKPEKVIDNILRVTQHLQSKYENVLHSREHLRLIPAVNGAFFYKSDKGAYWRVYNYIEKSVAFNVLQSPTQAFDAAFAFGRFIFELRDLPGAPLYESITDFHNTPKRFEEFVAAIETDICNRAKDIKEEIKFLLNAKKEAFWLTDAYKSGKIPLRTIHNDTKLNNILFDNQTGKVICIVDLDTVMPGLSLYDFGDMVRSMAFASSEDIKDLSKIHFNPDIYEKLVKGFLAGAQNSFCNEEIKLFSHSANVITYEVALRFISDYLNGDIYFKTKFQTHNLIRARVHIKMLKNLQIIENE